MCKLVNLEEYSLGQSLRANLKVAEGAVGLSRLYPFIGTKLYNEIRIGEINDRFFSLEELKKQLSYLILNFQGHSFRITFKPEPWHGYSQITSIFFP